MNAILLTNGTDRQARTLPRKASAPCVPAQRRGATADDNSTQEAIVKSTIQQHPTQNYRKWAAAGAGVETALFVSVQAVMAVCVVLVAAQLFATV